MKKTWIICFVIGLGVGPLLRGESKPFILGSVDRNSKAIQVSPLALLVNPEKYDGRKVQTDMYVCMDSGHGHIESPNLLFALREDLEERRDSHAFVMMLRKDLVETPDWAKEIANKRAIVVGIFRMNTSWRHYMGGAGALEEIEFLMVGPDQQRRKQD